MNANYRIFTFITFGMAIWAVIVAYSARARVDESAGLSVLDEGGALRIEIGLGVDSPVLAFLDRVGKPSMGMAVVHGFPRLSFFDNIGRRRIALGIQDVGPVLALLDQNGQARVAMGIRDGVPGVCITDSAGRLRASVRTDADGNPVIECFDEDGNVTWSAP